MRRWKWGGRLSWLRFVMPCVGVATAGFFLAQTLEPSGTAVAAPGTLPALGASVGVTVPTVTVPTVTVPTVTVPTATVPTVTVPTVTVPTVTVPTVTVPTVTVPATTTTTPVTTVTTPAVTTQPVPTVPAPPATTPLPPAPVPPSRTTTQPAKPAPSPSTTGSRTGPPSPTTTRPAAGPPAPSESAPSGDPTGARPSTRRTVVGPRAAGSAKRAPAIGFVEQLGIVGAEASRANSGRASRRAVTIHFMLRRSGRVTFTIRGPAPSCATLGKWTVRGHRGTNHLRVTNRVGRRVLRRGTYRIVLQPSLRGRVIVVRIGAKGRIAPASTRLFPAGRCQTSGAVAPTAAASPAAAAASGVEHLQEPRSGVLARRSGAWTPAVDDDFARGGMSGPLAVVRSSNAKAGKSAAARLLSSTRPGGDSFWIVVVGGLLLLSIRPLHIVAGTWRSRARQR